MADKEKNDYEQRAEKWSDLRHPRQALITMAAALLAALMVGGVVYLWGAAADGVRQDREAALAAEVKRLRAELYEEREKYLRSDSGSDRMASELQAVKQERENLSEQVRTLEAEREELWAESEARLAALAELQMVLVDPGAPRPSIEELAALEPELRARFSDWFALWQTAIPGFSARAFVKTGKRDMEKLSWPLEADFFEAEKDRLELCVWSPDRELCASPHWCYGEVDSCVTLVDKGKNKLRRLSFCGTPCSFDALMWLGERRFLVLGTYEEWKSNKTEWRAEIAVHDLADDTITVYRGPAAQNPDFKKAYMEYVSARMKKLGVDY